MLLVFQHSDSSTIGTLGPVLAEFAQGLRIVRIHRGDAIPLDLDEVDGIISLGGPQSANDESPVLRREMDLMRTAHAMGLPLFGICLGCQLMAKALGGEVAKLGSGAPAGGAAVQPPPSAAEIGWHEVALTPTGREEPLFAGIGWKTMQFGWHNDEVTKLPPGGRLLASSAKCKVQAWGLDLRTFAVQYHPEVDEATIQRYTREGAHELSTAGLSSTALIEGTRGHLADMMRWSQRLFEQWALLVAPVDRRYRGIAKDLVH